MLCAARTGSATEGSITWPGGVAALLVSLVLCYAASRSRASGPELLVALASLHFGLAAFINIPEGVLFDVIQIGAAPVLRAPAIIAALYPALRTMRSRREALVLAALGLQAIGLSELLAANDLMPPRVRLVHGLEMAPYYAFYGWLVARWFGIKAPGTGTPASYPADSTLSENLRPSSFPGPNPGAVRRGRVPEWQATGGKRPPAAGRVGLDYRG